MHRQNQHTDRHWTAENKDTGVDGAVEFHKVTKHSTRQSPITSHFIIIIVIAYFITAVNKTLSKTLSSSGITHVGMVVE